MAWLSGWAADQRFECTIDYTKIDATLTDFPVCLKLSDSCGINDADVTDFFDKLVFDVTGDDFTGTSGPPDPQLWTKYYGGFAYAPVLSNNRLKLECWMGGDSRIDSNFLLGGDISVEIDFDYSSGGSGSLKKNLMLELRIGQGGFEKDEDNVIQAYRSWLDDKYYGLSRIGGSETSSSLATTDTSGKFRVRRSGSTWYADYWNGSGWTNIHSASSCPSVDLNVGASLNMDNFNAMIGYVDNFVINTGTVVWPADTNPNKLKIAITGSDGTTEQKVEIERFNGEEAWLHTKVPSVSNVADTILYLYYDAAHADNTANVGATLSTPAKAVWNSDFVGVWHLGQDPSLGDGSIKDSTGNLLHGDPEGTMTAADLVDGKAAKCLEFDGADDGVNTGRGVLLDNIIFTVEAIINAETWGGGSNNEGIIASKYGSGGEGSDGWSFRIMRDAIQEPPSFQNGLQFLHWTSATGIWEAPDCISLATWLSVAASFDPTPSEFNDPILYVDGVVVDSPKRSTYSGFQNDDPWDFYIGRSYFTSTCFDGLIDEVRLSGIIRAEEWIAATHETLFDNLISYDGPGVGAGAGVASIISNEVIHSGLFGGQLAR